MTGNARTATAIKGQLSKFSGIIAKELSKAKQRLIKEMLYGIQAAKDIKLASVTRVLNEPIPLIKTEDRLSRKLDDEDFTEEINNEICQLGSAKVVEDMVIAIDPGDIRKKYAVPYLPYFWGIWSFSKNKSTAKDLLTFLMERRQVEEREIAVDGFDIPPFISMSDFKIWSEVKPPRGTLFNYPVRPFHKCGPSIFAYPAQREIAVQIYNRATVTTMVAKMAKGGQSMDQVLNWAQDKLEGFRCG